MRFEYIRLAPAPEYSRGYTYLLGNTPVLNIGGAASVAC
jgi:hypothetical protein